MITRACISINNNCNLKCRYCHFSEKNDSIDIIKMDIMKILNNIIKYINKFNISSFKLGFVGNGEPLLNYEDLKRYILHISDYLKSGKISAYIITNGTLLTEEHLNFFKQNNINVGFSIDGIKEIHNTLRCNTYDKVMNAIETYRSINGEYPSMNCTVGKDIIENQEETIKFFEKFKNRITFSRMIGNYEINMDSFNEFINQALDSLNVRKGTYDCTMYGGLCAAGVDNIFYSNDKIFICGNCIDIGISLPFDTELDKIDFSLKPFDRKQCFKEVLLK